MQNIYIPSWLFKGSLLLMTLNTIITWECLGLATMLEVLYTNKRSSQQLQHLLASKSFSPDREASKFINGHTTQESTAAYNFSYKCQYLKKTEWSGSKYFTLLKCFHLLTYKYASHSIFMYYYLSPLYKI